MKKQLLMSPHAHSPTTPQTTQSEGQTRHSAFQFHPHQPLSHLPRSQDHNTHLNAAFVQNNQQPPTVTIVPAPAHSSAPKSVQASSLTAPSPQPARIVGQGNTPSTTPSVQSVPLTSPVVAEGVAQEGVATVMSRTPSATSPIGREVKPNELSSSELASKPVFLRLFNHMFEQVSGLPKIEYECTFCRKRVIQGQEPERVGDDPNEWMSHCRTIHPKMYAKAMVAALNESASPAPTSPPTSAVPPTSAMPPSLVQSAPPATSSPPTPPLSSDPPVILQSTESIPTVPPPAPATQIPATFNQPDTIPLKNGRDSMGG
ncbi:uncharacterized protein EI90DRAFT_112769 [Cantharellus anzutake]|uniref:uncharacterized protein n=1 Tax=Cantharellus anzutake TaxID=1750568 RepID=UPI0019060609|nr:uncharacterized protein EI90DRAFT_112769 [Cantharellus anzutake]KAF8318302.1 hypothetical protein EI90DRAFT_112769 [Cantharellus anzutake]